MKLFFKLAIQIALISLAIKVSATEAENVKSARINPFALPTWGLSFSQFKQQKILDVTGKDNKTNSTSNKILTLTLDKAMYKKYISYELGFSGLYNSDRNETTSSEGEEVNLPTYIGIDTVFAIRGRVPFQIGSAGDIAITASAGAGISALLFGEARGDEANNQGKIIWSRFGFVKTISYGVHYFPIKWLAITIELQNRFYNYYKDNKKDKSGSIVNIEDNLRYKKPFSFSTDNALVIGFKTTA